MDREPIKIEIGKNLEVEPEEIYQSNVVKSGNGAVIKSFKRFLGKKAVVIIANKIIKTNRDKEERE